MKFLKAFAIHFTHALFAIAIAIGLLITTEYAWRNYRGIGVLFFVAILYGIVNSIKIADEE
jgi:hypothetical protein